MKYTIRGKGEIDLQPSDFVAQGGEGAVYAWGDTACKIYADPGKMIPAAKIQELSALTRPNILRPLDIVLDTKNRPVGYTMRRAQNAVTLCQIFPRAFRERQGLTPEAIAKLAEALRDGVQYIHARGMLIVDLNEMNLLVDLAAREILFLDVDSYQTPAFKATAIADSIRDRHAAQFSAGTDWFAFAIITFQMFVGIHPYRGKDFGGRDMETRMRQNISVFHPDVSVPGSCSPFLTIPKPYREWYQAVFAQGKRCPPPDMGTGNSVAVPVVAPLSGRDAMNIKELRRFPAPVVAPILQGLDYGAITTGGVFLGPRHFPLRPDVIVGATPRWNHLIAAWREGSTIHFFDLTQNAALTATLSGDAIMSYAERLYVKSGDVLSEILFLELPAGIQAALNPVADVLSGATTLYDGVAFQSLLGACYAAVFPETGVCHNVRLPELDAYRIINARFENRVLMAVGEKSGRYDRLVLRFDLNYRAYDLRTVPDVTQTDINFATLDNGVCVHAASDDHLELFADTPASPALRTVATCALRGARLFKNGTQLLCANGDALYLLSLTP